MARSSRTLVDALRRTAARLRAGERYQWSFQGACNCGHLAQTLTGLGPAELHARALEKPGDWREHAEQWCETSAYPIDQVIRMMLKAGLNIDEVAALERLSDPRVLQHVPSQARPLDYRRREDVVLYFDAWATLLEAELDREAREAA